VGGESKPQVASTKNMSELRHFFGFFELLRREKRAEEGSRRRPMTMLRL